MVAAIVSSIIALVAAIIAIRTLQQLVTQVKAGVQSNEINQLNALLLLEQDMSRRKDRIGEIQTELTTLQKSAAYTSDNTILEPAIRQYKESVENYLNSLDRLCFCILWNKFSENELRSEYRDVVRTTLLDFKDHFHAGTDFKNIVKIHRKWASS
jgi:hypothetical protein